MLMRRIRYWLGSAKRETALRAEMELHIEEKTAELCANGLSEPDARGEARRRFGNLGVKEEQAREIWIARYWSEFWQDLRYGARNLKRNPGFAAVAILSAALGIGACSTVFSIVNFAVLRPLPVTEPDRLMTITGLKKGTPGGSMSYPEVRDIGNRTRAWEGVAAFAPFLPAGIGSGEVRRQWGLLVTANYFDVVKPVFTVGRGFVRGEDDVPGAPAKIVLGHALWQSRFAADPGILGRIVQVNRRAMTVVGVTGPGFRGTEVGIAADFFLPFSQISELDVLKGEDNRDRLASYNSQWLTGLGRLRPGVDVRQARAELDTAAGGIRASAQALPRDRRFYAERAGQLLPFLRKIAIPAMLLLLTVTFLVLLTACANVANLLLARASARGQEIATRLAVGAGRGRLIRQLLTESLLLALGGGVLGAALAEWAGRHIAGFRLPLPLPIDLTTGWCCFRRRSLSLPESRSVWFPPSAPPGQI
jgi:predicted permease